MRSVPTRSVKRFNILFHFFARLEDGYSFYSRKWLDKNKILSLCSIVHNDFVPLFMVSYWTTLQPFPIVNFDAGTSRLLFQL